MDDDPALIAAMATMLQGISLAPARLPEIAGEVRRLNDAVRNATRHLTFDDDPAAYAVLLTKAAPR